VRDSIQAIFDAEIASVPATELARAARELTERYRGERQHAAPLIQSAAHRAAYLAVRMPATFAAMSSALQRLRESARQFAPETCVDLGAGPGTATLAALELFPTLRRCTLIERDQQMLSIARRMMGGMDAEFSNSDIAAKDIPEAELVLCAYVLNELPSSARQRALDAAWHRTRGALVIIEPGSRQGFANVLSARQYMIGQPDARIAAPCPGHMPCSLEQVGDWCHFSARVQRTSLHRRLKDASLAYEDEKFSYVIAVRNHIEVQPAETRIVRRPERLKGHVKLQLCTCSGLQQEVVTKKNGAEYKQARGAEWGDGWRSSSE
jgi:ribosomal protein RSM22 (predicted rRNA methylase)